MPLLCLHATKGNSIVKYHRTVIALLSFFLLSACSKETGNAREVPPPEPAVTAEEVAAPVEAADEVEIIMEIEIMPGLNSTVLKTGEGPAAAVGDTVSVHYTGWLYDSTAEDNRGNKFDSSVDRGELFRFPLGAGRVIKGWDQGVEGMLIGEKRELRIAPELAYGDRGAGAVIPPGATLIFEIELFELN